ncbi:MAG: Gfo/Idh/MocA family oxidoreductase [Anaerolineae bacterium]|nr:Gfo/Idh/MocA family oxidoreductase [Anaerolineae bacterium]
MTTENQLAKNFALIGAGGYIAPRHLKAIYDTGNRLIVALDLNDSVGILDRYFPDASFFTEPERFDRFLSKLKRANTADRIDCVSICSPNYLHDAHIRMALRNGADAICEKPVVINPWNVDELAEIEHETGKRINTVLQLRFHEPLVKLKQKLASAPAREKVDVELTYVTRRGRWYDISWKGSEEKSGGVAMNIGIHFFDLCIWLFGAAEHHEVHLHDTRHMAGIMELERARVRWYLSIDAADIPKPQLALGKSAFRSLTIDGEEIEFSEGFADLHTVVYRETLAGRGFTLADARPSIEAVYQIRHSEVVHPRENAHTYLRR